MKKIIILENINFSSLLFLLYFFFIFQKVSIYYVDSSKFFLLIFNIFFKYRFGKITKFIFKSDSLFKSDKYSMIRYIQNHELNSFFKFVIKKDLVNYLNNTNNFNDNTYIYFKKSLTKSKWAYCNNKMIIHFLMMINAAAKIFDTHNSKNQIYFFVDSRFFNKNIKQYCLRMKINLFTNTFISILKFSNIYTFIKKIYILRILFYYISSLILIYQNKFKKNNDNIKFNKNDIISIESIISDLPDDDKFWLKFNKLSKKIIYMGTDHTMSYHDNIKYKKHKFNYISLNHNISRNKNVSLFYLNFISIFKFLKNFQLHFLTQKVLFQSVLNEFKYYEFLFFNYFKKYNVKIFCSDYKWQPRVSAACLAIKKIGGVSTITQRTFYSHCHSYAAIQADVFFNFSNYFNNYEINNESKINYAISIGYINDYRFKLFKDKSLNIRNSLLSNGANKIISFFDENSSSDERWHIGDERVKKNYEFLLNKLLSDKEIGLVIKPKKYNTLYNRLGTVSELLDEAINTNRCYIFRENYIYSPSDAAMASDIAIHDDFASGTAGLEAILCGIPNLWLDLDNINDSGISIYKKYNLVHYNWDNVWKKLDDFFNNKSSIDMKKILELSKIYDPFQDGKAIYRMYEYLNLISRSLYEFKNKDDALSIASQEYIKKWGPDKVNYLGEYK